LSDNREVRNVDWLKGLNYPLQTYAWSGMQLGASQDLAERGGKRPTDAAPMSITSQPPGAFADTDENWILTYGASHDCVLAIFNGGKFKTATIDNIELAENSVYRRSIGNADFHIYDLINIPGATPTISPGVQQVDFIVGRETAEEARSDFFANIDTVEDARTLSMRVPLMAAGWGRTIGMLPTDSSSADPRDNDIEHKLARESWKLGPIDLRWDERRGVWGAWNDLIADQEKKNLGTLVFSTNPDVACGFPFLKGRLEDTWHVLKTETFSGDVGDSSDTEQSAEITTHLGHIWSQFNPDEIYKYAALSSTFKIHRAVKDAPITTCGMEKTQRAEQIEILTGTYFHLDDNFDGPICFSIDDVGSDLIGCMKFDGAQWIPAVEFDPCVDVGFELDILYQNDKILADKIIEVCKMILILLGKATGSVDPAKAKGAADASEKAADSAGKAEAALDGLPSGSGTGGEYVAGDTLQSGGQPLTAAEASALNDSLPAASEAYQDSSAKQQEAADAANDAADSTTAANTAAQDLGEAVGKADAAQKLADNANADLVVSPNDPSTIEAARDANNANAVAQADKNAEQAKFNAANEKADADVQTAKAADKEANDAAKDAKTKADQVKEDAGDKLPAEVKDAMDKADADAEAARKARENAGLHDVDDEKEEDCCPCCDRIEEELGNRISGVECKNQADLVSMGQAVGETIQKALKDLAMSVDNSLTGLRSSINDKLGSSIPGYNPETGTGGVEFPPTEIPPVCPIDTTGGASPCPKSTTTKKTPKRVTSKPRVKKGPGSDAGDPELGPPIGGDPSDVPIPPKPMCPIITIKDPCGGFSTHGPCPGGKGAGAPGGKPKPGAGDPGTPEGAPTGGANPNNGQVFKPTGKTVGLGGQNTPLPGGPSKSFRPIGGN